ncbi:MAG TPA: amino acid ABC transporter permease [Bordetella sp.]
MVPTTGVTSFLTGIHLLLVGAGVTAGISIVAICLGFLFASLVCVACMSRSRPLRFAGEVYVSFFRGVPLLIQLLVLYYLLPFIGLDLPPVVAGTLGLALCTSAYQAENLRGGLLTIPAGQEEAARAFGYNVVQRWTRILLPQALRLSMPMIVNEMIAILKASSLVSVVGITDLTRVSQNIVARNFQPIQWYATAALFYLAINLVLSYFSRVAGRRLGRSHSGAML